MIPVSKITEAVNLFALNDVIPKITDNLTKFIAYAAVGAMRGQDPMRLLDPYRSILESVGILKDGLVDEVALQNALNEAFSNVHSVRLGSFTFDENDKERLMRRILQ